MTASPNYTGVLPGGGSIVDSHGNIWSVSARGQVVENGKVDAGTNRVIEMVYQGGLIWQENADKLWWAKTGGPGSYDGWSSGPGTNNANGTPTPPIPVSVALNVGGTVNIAGNDLNGGSVVLNGGSYGSASRFNVNVSGTDRFSLAGAPQSAGLAVVNLADKSEWVGGFASAGSGSGFGGTVVIQATGHGTGLFDNTGSRVMWAATINANVVGTGTFNVASAHSNAVLEFGRGVSAGQSLNISGYADYGGQHGQVIVDDTKDFHASVTMAFGDILLKGIAADSYSYKNDVLSLYKGAAIVKSISLAMLPDSSLPGSVHLGVSAGGGNVMIAGDQSHLGTPLTLHA